MKKLLFIKSNPKKDSESNTFRLANIFMDEYKKNNPNDEIITLDLYKENLKPLDENLLKQIFMGEENDAKKHAELFASCDKYVVAAPMWNFTFPAILKMYIDYISYVGITFKYTQNGPVGLLSDKNKKAVHIVSRGGIYTTEKTQEYELGDKYLKTLFKFFGINHFETIPFELTNALDKTQLEIARENINKKAIEVAKNF